jgi:hypothetical protein
LKALVESSVRSNVKSRVRYVGTRWSH